MGSSDAPKSSSEKRFMWLGPILALILVSLGALFVSWLLDRRSPMEAVSGEFVRWDEANPRQGLVIWHGIQRRSSCTGTIYRYIVNGEIIALTPRTWEYRGPIEDPEKNPRTWEAPFEVPDHVNHDASYRNRFEFICNPLHKVFPIIVAPPDVEFSLPESQRKPGYTTRTRSHGEMRPGDAGGTE